MRPSTLLLVLAFAVPAAAAEAPLDAARLDGLTGFKGALDAQSGVYKIQYPRTDIVAAVGDVALTPPMGLTAWAAFTGTADHAMVMGDLVLTEGQVNQVMSAALDNGLEVTALHNHFLWDSPRVMFMHVGGMGPQETLGKAVGAVFAKLKSTAGGKSGTPPGRVDPAKTSLNTSALDQALGSKGQLANGVYKAVFGLDAEMSGHKIGAAMGVNTWAAFAGTDEQAVVDGDFAVYETQLQAVLRALRAAGVDIAAIHNHMTMEKPRVLFLHYWGVGKAADLAKAVRSALDAQKGAGAATP